MAKKLKRKITEKSANALVVQRPMTDQQAFLAMIDRAARDPSVDVGKMRELLAMRDADQERMAKQAFSSALVDCQILIQPIKKNMQADRFKYASLEALDDAIKGIYSAAGFALSYNSAPLEGATNRILVMCDVIHKAGHTRHYQVPMSVSPKGPKGTDVMTMTQAEGAAVSFGRRYLLLMIFNIITSEDDNAITMKGGPIGDSQLAELHGLLRQKPPINEKTFCEYLGVDSLINLPEGKFAEAKAELELKRKQLAGAA